MARYSYARAARHLRYAEDLLARADLDPARRERLEEIAAHQRHLLARRCECCGRALSDPQAHIGPVCERKAVLA